MTVDGVREPGARRLEPGALARDLKPRVHDEEQQGQVNPAPARFQGSLPCILDQPEGQERERSYGDDTHGPGFVRPPGESREVADGDDAQVHDHGVRTSVRPRCARRKAAESAPGHEPCAG